MILGLESAAPSFFAPLIPLFGFVTLVFAVALFLGFALTSLIKRPLATFAGCVFLNFLSVCLVIFTTPEIWIPYGVLSMTFLGGASAIVVFQPKGLRRAELFTSTAIAGMIALCWIRFLQQEKRDAELFSHLAGKWFVKSRFEQDKVIFIDQNGRIRGSLRGQFHHWNEGARTISVRTFGVDTSFDHGSHPFLFDGKSVETFLPGFGQCVLHRTEVRNPDFDEQGEQIERNSMNWVRHPAFELCNLKA